MVGSIYDYPEVDFSPLLAPGKLFAVRCESEDEAKHFIAAMMIQFPAKAGDFDLSNTRWHNDNAGRFGGRAYFPDLNNKEEINLIVGDVQYAKDHRYKLVRFSDLIDQSQIEESDMTVEDLLFV